jgi:hypothetical protein
MTAIPEQASQIIEGATPVPMDLRDREWTTKELLEHHFADPEWKIEGLLPEEGLLLLAGKRKIGKGWLMMQAAHALAAGGQFLGRPARQCKVLVYALEDNPRRISRRMKKQGVLDSAEIVWVFQWPGWEAVAERILKGEFGLCIIDTLSRAVSRVDQNDVTDVTELLSEWQGFALSNHVLVWASDHERKGSPGVAHSMDEVLGSQAKTAVADAIIQIHRDRGHHDTILSADGRDYEDEVELVVKFNRQLACWQAVGTPQEVGQGARKEVLDAIGKLQKAEELPTTKRLAEEAGKSQSYISELLADLVSEGLLIKGEKIGREQPYFLPGTDLSKWYESSNDSTE